MGVDFLRAKSRLLHLFKLCCLSITARSGEFPSVTFGNIGPMGPHGRFADVVLPGQSYLSGDPIRSRSEVRIQVYRNSPSLHLILEGQHLPPRMILGIMWTHLDIPKSIRLYCLLTR